MRRPSTVVALLALAAACVSLALVLPASAAPSSSWSPPVAVRANSTTASDALFASSPAGVAATAWTEHNISGPDDVWVSTADFSGAWSAPEPVMNATEAGTYIEVLDVAVDAVGRVAVLAIVQTYDDLNGTYDWQWWVAQTSAGGGVTSQQMLLNATNWSPGKIAYGAGGVLHVLIEDPGDFVNLTIRAYAYAPGDGWSGPVTLASSSGSLFPGLALLSADPSGLAGASWTVFNETGIAMEAWGMVYTPASGWGVPEFLGSGPEGALAWSVLAVTDRVYFAFSEYEASRGVLRTREAVPGAGLSLPLNVSDSSTGAVWAQLAADDRGYLTAVWQEAVGGARHIFAARRAPGASWVASGQLDTAAGNASVPHLSVDAAGGATVAWSQPSSGNATVHAARFAPGGGWQAPTTLSDGVGTKVLAGVGSAGDRTLVAWWGRVGSLRSISAAMFERDNVPPALNLDWIPEIVNTLDVTISGITEPGVALLIDGVAVAVNASGLFGVTYTFSEGATPVWVEAIDAEGNRATEVVVVTVDAHCDLRLTFPTEGLATNASVILVSGSVEAGATVLVLGVPVPVVEGTFTTQAVLVAGDNLIWVQAVDALGNVAVAQANVTFDDPLVPVLASLAEATAALDRVESDLANKSAAVAALGAELAGATAALGAAESQLASLAANGSADAARIGELQGRLATEQQRANATAASLQAAQEQAQAAQDRADAATSRAEAAEAAAGTAQLLGAVGVLLGAVGIVVGLLAGRKGRARGTRPDVPQQPP